MATVSFSVDEAFHSLDSVGVFSTDPAVFTAERGDEMTCASLGASDLL
jgi:hypothetical protein